MAKNYPNIFLCSSGKIRPIASMCRLIRSEEDLSAPSGKLTSFFVLVIRKVAKGVLRIRHCDEGFFSFRCQLRPFEILGKPLENARLLVSPFIYRFPCIWIASGMVGAGESH